MRPTGSWPTQYAQHVGPAATILVAAAQTAMVNESDHYQAAILAETGIAPAAKPGILNPPAFAGVAGDGRTVAGLLEQSIAHAGSRYETLAPTESPSDAAEQALQSAADWIEMTVASILADTERAATSAAFAADEGVQGFIRAINPPCCARCAILAGRFYKWDASFERHPRCDCYAIPAGERDWHALVQNPNTYFDSLTPAEQDKIFTIDGAQAIRDGADISQVVNARKGMTPAQTVAGTRLLTTSTGTGRKVKGRPQPARLMPESIYALASDRRDAIRLLREHGYIR